MKLARVAPTFKNRNKMHSTNYRKNSVSLDIAKTFERVLLTQMTDFIDKRKCGNEKLFVFHKITSAADAVLQQVEPVSASNLNKIKRLLLFFLILPKFVIPFRIAYFSKKIELYGFPRKQKICCLHLLLTADRKSNLLDSYKTYWASFQNKLELSIH